MPPRTFKYWPRLLFGMNCCEPTIMEPTGAETLSKGRTYGVEIARSLRDGIPESDAALRCGLPSRWTLDLRCCVRNGRTLSSNLGFLYVFRRIIESVPPLIFKRQAKRDANRSRSMPLARMGRLIEFFAECGSVRARSRLCGRCAAAAGYRGTRTEFCY